MTNKNKLRELKEDLSEASGTRVPQEDIASAIGKSVVELIERNTTQKTKDERTEIDKKLSEIRTSLTHSIEEVSTSLKDFQKSIEEDETLQEAIDAIDEDIESIHEEISELSDGIDEAFGETNKKSDDYSASIIALGSRLDEVSKTISSDFLAQFAEVKRTHGIFDTEIKSLRTNHALHLGKFDIVDKHFLQLEKDLKKYASQIYEYGTSFSILSNGSLVGMTNGLNLVAGTGMTINVVANSSGAITATFISSGGGGLTLLPATGSVNGTNGTFTFASLPTYLVIDGVWYLPKDSNNVVQWSNVGLTITTNITPINSIWGF